MCAAPHTFATGLTHRLFEQNRRGVHSRPRSNARRRTHVLAAPKWYTVMPKPHLSYPHVAIDLDKEKLTSISTDARAGT